MCALVYWRRRNSRRVKTKESRDFVCLFFCFNRGEVEEEEGERNSSARFFRLIDARLRRPLFFLWFVDGGVCWRAVMPTYSVERGGEPTCTLVVDAVYSLPATIQCFDHMTPPSLPRRGTRGATSKPSSSIHIWWCLLFFFSSSSFGSSFSHQTSSALCGLWYHYD